MTGPIVVPLDGSAFAESALPLATEMARRQARPIHLVLVHVPPPVLPRLGNIPDTQPALDEQFRRSEKAYLEGITGRVNEMGVSATPVQLDGPVAETISGYAMTSGAPCVVLCTHGRGGVSRWFLGSVADRLIRELHCPVLALHPGREVPALAEHGRRCVLVPLDGSPLAESTIDAVLGAWGREHIVLELLQIVAVAGTFAGVLDVPAVQPEVLRKALLEANRYLHDVAIRLRKAGLTVHTEVRVAERVAPAILRYADEVRPDLIALATRGQQGVERVLLGSVADKLLRSALVPVVVWNPPIGATSEVLRRTAGAPESMDQLAASAS